MRVISTTTQFQQLTKPGYADAADVAVLNTNFDKIDKIGTVLCTSSTRPSTNLFAGLEIYETDTKKVYRYDGAAWQAAACLGAWGGFTSTWTAASVNPSLGNGVSNSTFIQIGKTVNYRINFTAGSSTTFGTGAYSFSLPSDMVGGSYEPRGNFVIYDVSANARYGGVSWISTANTLRLSHFAVAGVSQDVGPTSPVTLASGDEIHIYGSYETP